MEKDETPHLKHGMFEDTSNFSHQEKLRVFEQAESYIEMLGGEDELNSVETYDCYYLAQLEYRIARAEGIMFEEVEEYLNKQSPENNLQMMVKRRQKLRQDLGLLSDSPRAKESEAKENFFDAMSESED